MTDSDIRFIASILLEELEAMKLTVIVVPDGRENSHRGVRAVVCPNPEWYSQLCQSHLALRRNRRWKRPRTIIKRCNTLRALRVIVDSGINRKFIYHQRLLSVIQSHAHTHRRESDARSIPTAGRSDPDW